MISKKDTNLAVAKMATKKGILANQIVEILGTFAIKLIEI
jgi:hypothetical protein